MLARVRAPVQARVLARAPVQARVLELVLPAAWDSEYPPIPLPLVGPAR
jgi:hypothetical protein